jgi:hypothetical protein
MNIAVDNLLATTQYVALLRRYRNGVAHFQSDYFDSRFQHFVMQSDSVSWIRNLHQALDRNSGSLVEYQIFIKPGIA